MDSQNWWEMGCCPKTGGRWEVETPAKPPDVEFNSQWSFSSDSAVVNSGQVALWSVAYFGGHWAMPLSLANILDFFSNVTCCAATCWQLTSY